MRIIKIRTFFSLLTALGLLVMIAECTKNQKTVSLPTSLLSTRTHDDIVRLYPKTAQEINERMDRSLIDMAHKLQAILTIPDDQRTWDNTVRAFDRVNALSDAAIIANVLSELEHVSQDQAVRDAAHAGALKIQEIFIDSIALNEPLYAALKAYAQGNAQREQLSDEQHYFLQETLRDYQRHGLDLPQEKRALVSQLLKDIAALELVFEENISKDNRTITVTREALAGVDESFIAALPRDDHGGYILGVDYPTYFTVMESCSIEATRKELFLAFTNRAYPANDPILLQVIAKRDQLANLLGFASYAHMDLDDAMAQRPERAQAFLDDVSSNIRIKMEQEFKELVADLPAGISLTADGQFKPWDYMYVTQQYKKRFLAVDESAIAEYFPMDSAVEGMLAVYREFLGIEFKERSIKGLWADDVRLIEVYTGDGSTLLAYLLLDLFPRAHKFTHACHCTTIPAVDLGDGNQPRALSLVIANFTKPTHDKPALLHRERDVETFFHEFGHALHAALGRTSLGSSSGTHVKRDFVEMPSQMLEEWLSDAGILKKISKHYVTGQPLPDELIAKIQRLKHFDTGHAIMRQTIFARLSLACYAPGEAKDVAALSRNLHKTFMHSIAYEPRAHGYAAFGHLMGYGAKYYGYLWSKVFALDLFNYIKSYGLLNPAIGRRYTDEILAKGGSQDPNILLKNFLGREPNADAFMQDLGLSK